MAYRIQYGASKPDRYRHAGSRKFRKWIAAFLLAGAIGIRLLCPQIGEDVRNFLLPGFDETAEAAFSSMVISLRKGMPVRDAVVTFCQEIIQNELAD